VPQRRKGILPARLKRVRFCRLAGVGGSAHGSVARFALCRWAVRAVSPRLPGKRGAQRTAAKCRVARLQRKRQVNSSSANLEHVDILEYPDFKKTYNKIGAKCIILVGFLICKMKTCIFAEISPDEEQRQIIRTKYLIVLSLRETDIR
jgi:ribosomal protein S14